MYDILTESDKDEDWESEEDEEEETEESRKRKRGENEKEEGGPEEKRTKIEVHLTERLIDKAVLLTESVLLGNLTARMKMLK